MNRKQKIIVSITGIILVSLILIGLTYAYFLTKITGNTNTKSISVTTANLVLEYGENTNVVQGITNAEPGYSVEKIFTATNKGNSTVTYGAALESIVNGLTRQEDLVYTLTCTSYLKEGFSLASNGTITGTVDGTCSGVTTEKQFPSTSAMSIMTTNTIDTTHTHAYKLTITYKEMNVDQSEDMNKTFSAKVNIVDLRASADNINPYSSNKKALNYQIINSSLEGGTDRTIYGSEVTTFLAPSKTENSDEGTLTVLPRRIRTYPTGFTIGAGNTKEDAMNFNDYFDDDNCENNIGKYIYIVSDEVDTLLGENTFKVEKCDGNLPVIKIKKKYEKVLNTAPDDYGTSYYYRGNVVDNFVKFANKIWRIVRINGDGSIRLVLDNAVQGDSSLYTEVVNAVSESNEHNNNELNNFMFGLARDNSEYVNTSNKCLKLSTDGKQAEIVNDVTNENDCIQKGYKWVKTPFDAANVNIVSSAAKINLETWYKENIVDTGNSKYVAENIFCEDKGDTKESVSSTYLGFNYFNEKRYTNPTYECAKNANNTYSRYTSKNNQNNTTLKGVKVNKDLTYPIGSMTLDEFIYAGGYNSGNNINFYLMSMSGNDIKLMTPNVATDIYTNYFAYNTNNGFVFDDVSNGENFSQLPVINLRSDVVVAKGNGTENNPYEVKLANE